MSTAQLAWLGSVSVEIQSGLTWSHWVTVSAKQRVSGANGIKRLAHISPDRQKLDQIVTPGMMKVFYYCVLII